MHSNSALLLVLSIFAIAACTATTTATSTSLPTNEPTTIPATAVPTALPTEQPTILPATAAPTESTFALATAPASTLQIGSWYLFNPSYVEAVEDNGALILTLKGRALWFMQDRGVLAYQLVRGNFRLTATVRASKASDPTQPPAGPVVQLGGLMARNPSNGLENYVFIVVGQDTNDLSVETKTTTDSVSKWDGPSWGSAEAELALCRIDATFNLYKRHIGDSTWELAKSFTRPDLPDTLQVGPNIYSDGKPDLQVRYEGLKIEPIEDESGCTIS